MDISSAQRINRLAGELKRHGFARTSSDGLEQAERIFIDAELPKEDNGAAPQRPSNDDDLYRRFQALLAQQNQRLASGMQQLQVTIDSMKQEIAGLKGELAQAKSQLRSASTAQPNEPAPSPTAEPQQTLKTEEKPKEEQRPYSQRVGNWKSEDVSIEKMFYYGKK
ncbi:hypothetical protein JXB02_06610 [Candidatus Woesearchaeota archaeon]|nr:hypothetical protein [Candidatus Woesearchaeota archaeon]